MLVRGWLKWNPLYIVDGNVKQFSDSGKLFASSWIFIGRTDDEAEAPILWPTDAKSWLIRKGPDPGKDWRQEEKGMTEDEMVGWHHWLNRQWVWASSGRWGKTGKPGVLQSRGSQRVRDDWATELNWWHMHCCPKKVKFNQSILSLSAFFFLITRKQVFTWNSP